jgi:hypothetical protein
MTAARLGRAGTAGTRPRPKRYCHKLVPVFEKMKRNRANGAGSWSGSRPSPRWRLMTELAECGGAVSYGTVWNFIHREGMSFKKKRAAGRARSPRHGAPPRAGKISDEIDPARLVFIDEPWVKTNMAPIRGRRARGRRLAAKIPHDHWRCDRVEARWVLAGPINGESFRTYVDQVLVPTLKPGDVVILDNSPPAGSGVLRSVATRAGRRAAPSGLPGKASVLAALFPRPQPHRSFGGLRRYFAKLNHLMRKAKERTVDATWTRTGSLLETFKSSECKNSLVNAGYASS